MANQILENLNKRSSELAEKGQKAINTAYQKGLNALGLDEEKVRVRVDQLKDRRVQLESALQKTFSDQLKEMQTVELRVLGRLEDTVVGLKDLVSANSRKVADNLDKIEKRLQDLEKAVSSRMNQLPIEDYDLLNADEIVRKVETLGNEGLQALRKYETDHKGRVTILKAIDAKLAA